MSETNGPGPLVLGKDRDDTFIVRPPGDRPLVNVRTLEHLWPVGQQWAAGTPNGLIASWPNRRIAENYAKQKGTQLMQVLPVTITADMVGMRVAVLADPDGCPLEGET